MRQARHEHGRHGLVAVVGRPHRRRSGRVAPDIDPVQLPGAPAQPDAQSEAVLAARPPVDDRPPVDRAAASALPARRSIAGRAEASSRLPAVTKTTRGVPAAPTGLPPEDQPRRDDRAAAHKQHRQNPSAHHEEGRLPMSRGLPSRRAPRDARRAPGRPRCRGSPPGSLDSAPARCQASLRRPGGRRPVRSADTESTCPHPTCRKSRTGSERKAVPSRRGTVEAVVDGRGRTAGCGVRVASREARQSSRNARARRW